MHLREMREQREDVEAVVEQLASYAAEAAAVEPVEDVDLAVPVEEDHPWYMDYRQIVAETAMLVEEAQYYRDFVETAIRCFEDDDFPYTIDQYFPDSGYSLQERPEYEPE